MSFVYLGQILHGAWTFAPRGFHVCDGSLLPITQNTALFALIGTSYGGDGKSSFALPDARGRSLIGAGTGSGLTPCELGDSGGTEQVALLPENLPPHSHTATFTSTSSLSVAQTPSTHQQAQGDNASLLGRSIDTSSANAVAKIYVPANSTPTVKLGGLNIAGTVTVAPTGQNKPLYVRSPYVVAQCIIATVGQYPTQS